MRLFLSLPLLLIAACTVPDKFFSDAGGGGDDIIDADVSGPDAEPDTDAPETTLTMTPPDFSNDGTPSFEFASDEAGTFVCSFDGETAVACTSPYARSLSDGGHTFSVRAIDLAGNQDDIPAEHAWTIDTVAPVATIDSGPPAVDNSTSVLFMFSADETNVTFECQLDSAAYATCTSPSAQSVAAGAHTFRVRAIDRAGNVDATPDVHSWTVDTSTPDTTITSGPSGATASTGATFIFSSTNAGTSPTYECRRSPPGGAFTACTSPVTYTGLTDGTAYTFEVQVRNLAGTVDPTPATRTWTPDLTAPNTTFVSGNPSGSVSSTSANIAFTSNEAGSTFQCSLEGGTFTTCTSPSVQSGLSQGGHMFAVRAIDVAGNMDMSPASASWTVDTFAPTTSIVSGPSALSTSTTASFDFGSNEAGVTYQCRVGAAAFATCADPYVTTVGQGNHTLDVFAVDAAGNADASPVQHAWEVDTVDPIVSFVSPTPGAGTTVGPYNTYAWTVNRSATTTCSVNGSMPQACTSPISGHIQAGATTFSVTATDDHGNTATFNRSFTIACSAAVADANTFGLLHMNEGTGQSLTNAGNGGGNGILGTTIDNETSDPLWTTAGRFGSGLSFVAADGDTVSWNLGLAMAYTTHDHTIEVWVRPSSFTTSAQDVFATSLGVVRLTLEPSGGSYYAEYAIVGGGTTTRVRAGTALTAGVWHHLVATYTGTTMTLYQDAESKVTTTPTITGTFTFSGIRINTFAKPMPGEIDEVWLSKAALTTAEVLPRYCPPP